MSKIFSERLSEARSAKGITQKDLADILCKKRSTVSGYESTEAKEPDYDSLCIISKKLGVSADWLIGASDNPNAHLDDVLFNDNRAVVKCLRQLSPELQELFIKMFDDFYILVSRDLQAGDAERLELYSRLFSSLREHRSDVKKLVTQTASQDGALLIGELISKQNEFKSDISIILDAFLQSDLDAASNRK